MLGLPISPAIQRANLADGKTRFDVCGEVHTNIYKDTIQCGLDALVVRELGVDILAGIPFLVSNDITVDFAQRQICIQGITFSYDNDTMLNTSAVDTSTDMQVLRSPESSILLPGETTQVQLPPSFLKHHAVAIQPHVVRDTGDIWPPPQILSVTGDSIVIPNDTRDPIVLTKHQHFVQVHSVTTANLAGQHCAPQTSPLLQSPVGPFSAQISLDPENILPLSAKEEFECV